MSNVVLATCGVVLGTISTSVALRSYAGKRVTYVKGPDDAPRKWLGLHLLGCVMVAYGAFEISIWLAPIVVLVLLIVDGGQMLVHNRRVQRAGCER